MFTKNHFRWLNQRFKHERESERELQRKSLFLRPLASTRRTSRVPRGIFLWLVCLEFGICWMKREWSSEGVKVVKEWCSFQVSCDNCTCISDSSNAWRNLGWISTYLFIDVSYQLPKTPVWLEVDCHSSFLIPNSRSLSILSINKTLFINQKLKIKN